MLYFYSPFQCRNAFAPPRSASHCAPSSAYGLHGSNAIPLPTPFLFNICGSQIGHFLCRTIFLVCSFLFNLAAFPSRPAETHDACGWRLNVPVPLATQPILSLSCLPLTVGGIFSVCVACCSTAFLIRRGIVATRQPCWRTVVLAWTHLSSHLEPARPLFCPELCSSLPRPSSSRSSSVCSLSC